MKIINNNPVTNINNKRQILAILSIKPLIYITFNDIPQTQLNSPTKITLSLDSLITFDDFTNFIGIETIT
jgi:hypothetical protein